MSDREDLPLAPGQWHVPAPSGPPPPRPSTSPAPAAGPAAAASPVARPTPTGPSGRGGTVPSGPPAPAPAPAEGRTRARRRGGFRWRRALRPKLRWLYLYLPLAVVLLLAGTLAWAWWRFDSLYRVELGDALAAPGAAAVNYLLVGSDSRDGITADTPNAGVIGPGVTGRRSDTIIVLRLEGGRATMMSVPRDLWATNPATGKAGRINATYNQGPANLVRAVTQNLGIPIHHYLEVDFVSFSGMVDAMGGITVRFDHPVYDRNSGLNIISDGPVVLDGTQALAYVRSRHYVEVIDGREVPDPTADLGRQERQQTFIRTVLSEVGETRNPWTLLRIVGAAADGMRVDDQLGFGDVVSLARNLSGADPATVVLPTRGAKRGSASVLLLESGPATPVLAGFGGEPHTPQ